MQVIYIVAEFAVYGFCGISVNQLKVSAIYLANPYKSQVLPFTTSALHKQK